MTYSYIEVKRELETIEPDTHKFSFDKYSKGLARLKSKREALMIHYSELSKNDSQSVRKQIAVLTRKIEMKR